MPRVVVVPVLVLRLVGGAVLVLDLYTMGVPCLLASYNP
jgi:hypothetical protein